MPRRPFSKLCSSLLIRINCQNGVPTPTEARLCVLSITQLRVWARRRSAYAQLSPLHLLSTLYVTHVIKYSRPSTAFPYCKRRKAGQGLGMRLAKSRGRFFENGLFMPDYGSGVPPCNLYDKTKVGTLSQVDNFSQLNSGIKYA